MSWVRSIQTSKKLVSGASQANLVVIVSGSVRDTEYWVKSVQATRPDILSHGDDVQVVGVAEEKPAGNFLGTIAAWNDVARQNVPIPSSGISLMCMVFGQGTRLSPFTQALGNRKSALPTPYWGRHAQKHLRTIDLAILYSSLWMNHLSERGFSGVLIKWGDEATLPSLDWSAQAGDFSGRDMVRFVWKTEPTEMYAREKEWFIIDNQTDSVVGLIPRQPLESIRSIMSRYEGDRYSLAVNLGSLGVSYRLMEQMSTVFRDFGISARSADWDPAVSWLLLSDDGEGNEPVKNAIAQAETRFPGISQAIRTLKQSWANRYGRPLSTGYLDFGSALWIDLGLHESLRKCFEGLHDNSEYGEAIREFFSVNEPSDSHGNRVIRSTIHPSAQIRNSIIVDSSIGGGNIRQGVVVGSHAGTLNMPAGGTCLFSGGRIVEFTGPHAIALRAVGDHVELKEGERRTTLPLPGGDQDLSSFESLRKYDASVMDVPVFENRMSFSEAGRLTTAMHPADLETASDQALKRYQ